MTNSAVVESMASFMSKKKKYKFQVEINVEELLEVPFLSAVLFAKLRLLDGGNFQDTSARVEVKDHAVRWGARFSFPCKMLANASTGVLERCVLRISIRRESKGGRSFDKLGFVDLNLAEYAGSGETCKKALLEGYVNRHTRQDNSMLRFSIKMNMLSGDVLFKVPSPSTKHKQPSAITHTPDENTVDPSGDFSGGSLAGSIASGSSGFGSLPKKRTPLLSSELVVGHTLQEMGGNANVPQSTLENVENLLPPSSTECTTVYCEALEQSTHPNTTEAGGHSRNSSNTSQMSKASGYSSIHSSTYNTHSRQSSSGDSGHIREIQRAKLYLHHHLHALTTPSIPSTFLEVSSMSSPSTPNVSITTVIDEDVFHTPKGVLITGPSFESAQKARNYFSTTTTTTKNTKTYFMSQTSHISNTSNISSSNDEDYKTPDSSFSQHSPVFDLQRSISSNAVVEQRTRLQPKVPEFQRVSDNTDLKKEVKKEGVLRSKSDYQIPKLSPQPQVRSSDNNFFKNISQKSDSLFSFLTPLTRRRVANLSSSSSTENKQSSFIPKNSLNGDPFKKPGSPVHKYAPLRSMPKSRTSSLTSLKSASSNSNTKDGHNATTACQCVLQRGMTHRKLLLDGNVPPSNNSMGGKLAPLIVSPNCEDDPSACCLAAATATSSNTNTTTSPTCSSSATSSSCCNNVVSTTTSTVNAASASTSSAQDVQGNVSQPPRRPSVTNPSSGSLVLSETGSLDRAKAAMERRKKGSTKTHEQDNPISTRVEGTRVNPDDLIAEIINNTDLEPTDDSLESSGLQLFIAKDGTAALGNHEVKSQMQTGVQHFKQVVMGDANR